MTMGKRYKSPWKLGMVDHVHWGHYQTVTNLEGVTVVKVAVPEGNDGDLKLILASPRLKRVVIMMANAIARYGHAFSEPFDNDPEMMDAI
jgi:hypothetical protein